jgi:DNA-binding NtrC family response regulator
LICGSPAGGGAPPAGRALFCEADEGTLFLDCVEALAPPLQTRLLRFLQDEAVPSLGDSKPRPLDVRIIAATGCDLEAEVAAGRFREDLFYRLDVVRLDVPPLRERPRDIPLLFDHFLAHYRAALGKPDLSVADDALAHLCAYDWPGNVRELANAVERAVMLAPGDRISLRELPDALETPSGRGTPQSFSLKAARKSLEADLIRRALRASNGNRTHAARRLAISHRGLLYKIKEYGIRD